MMDVLVKGKMYVENTANILDSRTYLNILKETLVSAGTPSVYYSIGGYSEDAVCIECVGSHNWLVYDGEKGNKYNIKQYNSAMNACFDLISRLSESNDDESKIQLAFQRRVNACISYQNKSLYRKLR